MGSTWEDGVMTEALTLTHDEGHVLQELAEQTPHPAIGILNVAYYAERWVRAGDAAAVINSLIAKGCLVRDPRVPTNGHVTEAGRATLQSWIAETQR
jgi:hypothetical protein